MYETDTARNRSDKWDSLHHYRSHCVGDLDAGLRTIVGALGPSHSAAPVGQKHTLVSPPVGRGDEHTVGLAAPWFLWSL
jgi:hypothetical protein